MKVVILAGGFGTRISEESQFKPKPMIELGGMPILWHIMKLYGHYGFNEFVICAGYKQHVIKEYFADYFLHTSDVTFDFTNGANEITIHRSVSEPWKVTVVDTGLNTMTGGRIVPIVHSVEIPPSLDLIIDGPLGETQFPGDLSNWNFVSELFFQSYSFIVFHIVLFFRHSPPILSGLKCLTLNSLPPTASNRGRSHCNTPAQAAAWRRP